MTQTDTIRTTLRIELDAPAAPRHVLETARLFSEALSCLPESIHDDDVTLVVKNLALTAELRGRTASGREAVLTLGELVADPQQAVARRPELATAAAVVSRRLRRLRAMGASFFRDRSALPFVILDVPAARAAVIESAGTSTVETEILGFGKTGKHIEDGPLAIRVRLPAGLKYVKVPTHLVERSRDLAGTGKLVAIKFAGRWVRKAGVSEFKADEVVSIDDSAQIVSGKDFLALARASGVFTLASVAQLRQDLLGSRSS